MIILRRKSTNIYCITLCGLEFEDPLVLSIGLKKHGGTTEIWEMISKRQVHVFATDFLRSKTTQYHMMSLKLEPSLILDLIRLS